MGNLEIKTAEHAQDALTLLQRNIHDVFLKKIELIGDIVFKSPHYFGDSEVVIGLVLKEGEVLFQLKYDEIICRHIFEIDVSVVIDVLSLLEKKVQIYKVISEINLPSMKEPNVAIELTCGDHFFVHIHQVVFIGKNEEKKDIMGKKFFERQEVYVSVEFIELNTKFFERVS